MQEQQRQYFELLGIQGMAEINTKNGNFYFFTGINCYMYILEVVGLQRVERLCEHVHMARLLVGGLGMAGEGKFVN